MGICSFMDKDTPVEKRLGALGVNDNVLERENERLKQRILQLETELKDVESWKKVTLVKIQNRLNEYRHKNLDLEKDNKKLRKYIDKLKKKSPEEIINDYRNQEFFKVDFNPVPDRKASTQDERKFEAIQRLMGRG